MIKSDHIEEMKALTKHGICTKFNCWGATQYALGQRKRYGWIGENVMWRWLDSKTVVVLDELQVGDILVISDLKYNELIHTAVYMGNDLWFHKEGKFDASIETKDNVIEKYTNEEYFRGGRIPHIEIRRLTKK
jgi:cell wall-associated NlpC family hydrolase